MPDLRFLSTGFAHLDHALGGVGLPSSFVTHWRAPRAPASDALLLWLCRAACERGERVCLVDAANRFNTLELQNAGLDVFAAQGLFERLCLITFPQVARLADAWRRGENDGVPGLLVVDSLVATIGASLGSKRPGKPKTSYSKSSHLNTLAAPVFDPQAHKQGQVFSRLLVKLGGFARFCGGGMIVAEPPVESIKIRSRYRSKRRRNDFLEYAAQDALAKIARVALVLETNSIVTDVARVHVAPNRFA